MVRRFLIAASVCVAVLTTCDAAPQNGVTPSPVLTPSVDPTPTPPALPETPPPTGAEPSETCTSGWVTPKAGTPLADQSVGIVRRTAPFDGPVTVVDMRYFVGPESPPSDKGYILEIRRWYIKLFAPDDLAYQGRFIVEARRFGRGVAAVAPYDTHGFNSPDWVGFQWDAADTEPKGYPGLPGTWRGIPYDFVRGGAGLAIPGLPAEVGGCLEGT